MTIILIVAIISLLLLAGLYLTVRGQAAGAQDLRHLSSRSQPVNLAAFRTLISKEDEEYLRQHLPQGDFRKVQRRRMLATLEYLRRAAHNAALLMRIGEGMRANPDPKVSAAAQEVVDAALQMRLLAMLNITKIYCQLALPGVSLSVEGATEGYRHLTERALYLCRLQEPAEAATMAAAL